MRTYGPTDNGTSFPDDATQFQRYADAAKTAAGAPYGSIAYRNNPNQYGTIASRQFPGAFGPTGALNPEYQADQAAAANGMQRRQAGNDAVNYANMQAQFTAGALSPLFNNVYNKLDSDLQWPSFTPDANPPPSATPAPKTKAPSALSNGDSGMSRFGSALSAGARFAADPLGTMARASF